MRGSGSTYPSLYTVTEVRQPNRCCDEKQSFQLQFAGAMIWRLLVNVKDLDIPTAIIAHGQAQLLS
jgi:hypothetical protein